MSQVSDLLKTDKKESWHTKIFRVLMNLYPMFFGTGGRILFWSADWAEVHLRLKLNMWTRNYVKTIFGGSMFSATDPFYMLMFLHILGKDFVVWDKSATIKFKKPAKKALYAIFKISPELLNKLKNEIQQNGETTHVALIQWVDVDRVVYAELERTIYMASKDFYKQKLEKRKSTVS